MVTLKGPKTTRNIDYKHICTETTCKLGEPEEERMQRFKMLSGVMKSSELSKIFRRKELADNPTFNSAEGYELSLQHSLL